MYKRTIIKKEFIDMKKIVRWNTSFSARILGMAAALIFSAGAMTACQSQPTASTADYIGIDAAKDAALKAAGVPADQASFSAAGLDSRDGVFYYQVIFTENGIEREYDIDAMTGVVIEEKILTPAAETAAEKTQETETSRTESQESPEALSQTGEQTPAAQAIDEEGALSAALAHAGVAMEDISRSRVETDRDDGLMVFEVEFITADGTEYDYKISQADGSVISYSQDMHAPQSPASGTEGLISEDAARQAVMDRVPGASAADIALFLEEDDGRMEYEGHLAYGDMFYEFKIDAYSGTVTEWEAEARHSRS
mgnify:FL=1